MTESEQTYQDTRRRLLEAAGEVFSEQGFRATTIRDICTRAGANIAAVNYHFGDKERLYEEVIKNAFETCRQRYPSDGGLTADATPKERLRAFIYALLFRILDEEHIAWRGKLITREMIEPTIALEKLVQEVIRPEFEQIRDAIRDLLEPDADPEAVLQCVWSITGQCVFYFHARHIIARLRPQGEYTVADKERIAEHVTQFSLAAIECVRHTGRPTK